MAIERPVRSKNLSNLELMYSNRELRILNDQMMEKIKDITLKNKLLNEQSSLLKYANTRLEITLQELLSDSSVRESLGHK